MPGGTTRRPVSWLIWDVAPMGTAAPVDRPSCQPKRKEPEVVDKQLIQKAMFRGRLQATPSVFLFAGLYASTRFPSVYERARLGVAP
jgi:hypothetical protein